MTVDRQISTNSVVTNTTEYIGIRALEKSLESIRKLVSSMKTSFGPQGLDKMCVDTEGRVFITNDGATIVNHMQVDDPVSKIIIDLAQEQDRKVGDGTSTVVILAAYLVEEGYNMISKYNIHPSIVASAYRMALNETVEFIKNEVEVQISTESPLIKAIIKTSIASKIISGDSEHFVSIIASLVSSADSPVNIVKFIGKSMSDTELYDGFILNCALASHLMVSKAENAKILLCDFELGKTKMPLSVNISARPEDIEGIRLKEVELTKRDARKIIQSGATLVMFSGGVDDICIKMFIEAGVALVKRVDVDDLYTISSIADAPVHQSVHLINEEDQLRCSKDSWSFEEREFGEHRLICLGIPCRTVLIRGPNRQVCDEVQRSMNDAIQVTKRVLEQKMIVPGGGALEISVSHHLFDYSTKIGNREFIGIRAYADSLKNLVKLLCLNAGVDIGKVMGELLAKTASGVPAKRYYGLDLNGPSIQENLNAGIIEPSISKLSSLKAATEAAISILRINHIVEFPSKKDQ